jgi:hypothetical protein
MMNSLTFNFGATLVIVRDGTPPMVRFGFLRQNVLRANFQHTNAQARQMWSADDWKDRATIPDSFCSVSLQTVQFYRKLLGHRYRLAQSTCFCTVKKYPWLMHGVQ